MNGTFNPSAVKLGNKIYIIYRAISKNYISTTGLAISSDGFTIDEKYDEPIYLPRTPYEVNPLYRGRISPFTKYSLAKINWSLISGPSYFGTEDPRITRVGNKIYMTYVAFNGYWVMRSALTWIKVKDFKEGNWDEWAKPVLITHPAFPVKNVVLFNEPVKGKYTFYHRIYPHIWMDKVKHPYNDFAYEGRILFGHPVIRPKKRSWYSRKIAASAMPQKFMGHWLFTTHGVSLEDPHYRYATGLMLVHRTQHDRVLYHTDEPILFPSTWYEGKICYGSGMTIHNGYVFVYYGANDRHVAMAYAPVDEVKEKIREGMKYDEARKIPMEPHIKARSRVRLAGRRRIQPRRRKVRWRVRDVIQSPIRAA